MSNQATEGHNNAATVRVRPADPTTSEARQLAVLQSIDAIVWERDADCRTFTFVSDTAERILGYPVQAWLRDPGFWAKNIHPDDLEWCTTFSAQETKAERGHDLEYRMIDAGGRVVWFHDRVTVVPRKDEPSFLRGVMLDVTARKEASLRLARQEEQYRDIFDAATDGLFISDADDGTILEVNQAFRQMFGDLDTLAGRSASLASERGTLSTVLGTGVPGIEAGGRTVLGRADGSTFDAEVFCRPFRYKDRLATLGVVRDVTDQVRMEQVLEGRVLQRTQEFESLLEVARAVASTLDLRQVVRLVLEQLKNVVDYSAASLILLEGDELIVHDLVVDARYADKAAPPSGARFSISDLTDYQRSTEANVPTLDYPCVQVAASAQFWDDINEARTVVIQDVLHSEDAIAVEYREAMGKLLHTPAFGFIRTWMAAPLIVKGMTIGYIGIASDVPKSFTSKHARLAKAFADHASTAIENARLYQQAQALAAIEERERLARDLHDSVAQAMYGIALGARTARKYLRADVDAIEPIDYVVSLAAAGLAEMRALIFDLHPGAIAEEGLVRAIERQVGVVEARHGLSVGWSSGEEPDVDLKVKEAAYSVIREALHNIVKHAQAENVKLVIETLPGHLAFEIRDDGIGFDPDAAVPGHLGLRSMHDRLAKLGGTVKITSEPGRGTVVSGSLPARPHL